MQLVKGPSSREEQVGLLIKDGPRPQKQVSSQVAKTIQFGKGSHMREDSGPVHHPAKGLPKMSWE